MLDTIRPVINTGPPSGGANQVSGVSAARPVANQPGLQALTTASQTETNQTAAETAAKKSAAASQPGASLNGLEISLKFRTDEETGATTIFVVDRQTKKVLRTIPFSELNKISVGELINLTA